MGPGSSISPPSPPINPVWVFKSKFLQRQDRILLLNFMFLKFDDREMFLSLFQPQYLKKICVWTQPPFHINDSWISHAKYRCSGFGQNMLIIKAICFLAFSGDLV